MRAAQVQHGTATDSRRYRKLRRNARYQRPQSREGTPSGRPKTAYRHAGEPVADFAGGHSQRQIHVGGHLTIRNCHRLVSCADLHVGGLGVHGLEDGAALADRGNPQLQRTDWRAEDQRFGYNKMPSAAGEAAR